MPQRQLLVDWLSQAVAAGARKIRACREIGLSLRTLQRWTETNAIQADARTTVTRPTPRNALSEVERQAIVTLVLHSDNGAPMKSVTLLSKMYELGTTPSRGRPRVSNDNPYSESLFRALQYCPQWPQDGFASLDAARAWVRDFMRWYNTEHWTITSCPGT